MHALNFVKENTDIEKMRGGIVHIIILYLYLHKGRFKFLRKKYIRVETELKSVYWKDVRFAV
jgi:hypothetical protein